MWTPKDLTAKFPVASYAERHEKSTGGSFASGSPYLLPSQSSAQQVDLAFLLITDLDVVHFIFVQYHEDVRVGYCLFGAVSNQKSAILKG